MKITFVLPAIGKKRGEPYIRTWQRMEPLTFATLKALTPPEFETELFDDRSELVDYATETDLVAITTEVYTALRAYRIADRFRARGITTVIGGFHATLNPDEAAEHADAVVVGNAEEVWAGLLDDFRRGDLKPRYRGSAGVSPAIPDRSIYDGKDYMNVGVVETGRGCMHKCEFCAITAYYAATYHRKPIATIVAEIEQAKAAGRTNFFFADDNIVADTEYAQALFAAIEPLKILWAGQGTLVMARSARLLDLMRRSGCIMILIGYESLDDANLAQMGKSWNSSIGERDELTRKIHAAGISIYATFIFGFDHDSPGLFDETLSFALKHRFAVAAFNHLLVMPGTALHARMKAEGRLVKDRWWLDDGYHYGDIVFTPATMSADQLTTACVSARRRFYTFASIFGRVAAVLVRTRSLRACLILLVTNLKLRREVDGKQGMPLAGNLDELPK